MINFKNRMRCMLTASVVTLAAAATLAQGGPPPPGSFQRVPSLPFPDAARELRKLVNGQVLADLTRGIARPSAARPG